MELSRVHEAGDRGRFANVQMPVLEGEAGEVVHVRARPRARAAGGDLGCAGGSQRSKGSGLDGVLGI